jgi:hypothetical protein
MWRASFGSCLSGKILFSAEEGGRISRNWVCDITKAEPLSPAPDPVTEKASANGIARELTGSVGGSMDIYENVKK